MVEGLPHLAMKLAAAEHAQEDLVSLLERSRELIKEVELYSAGAVLDARRAGRSWEGVARAARVSAHTARERWSETATEDRLAAHLSACDQGACRFPTAISSQRGGLIAACEEPLAEGQMSTTHARRLLADALYFLHQQSGLALRDVAVAVGVSPSYISRILSGDRLPAWHQAEAMAAKYKAEAAILRNLWETSQALTPLPRPPLQRATERVAFALQGLHTAAGRPVPDDVHDRCAGVLSPKTIEMVLAGRCVPDWPEVSALVTALNGEPQGIRPLWEEFHYTWLRVFDQALPGDDGMPADGDSRGEPC
ncbi:MULTISPECIES: helix-turn-helix domain-containing protein [Streptomyces]|uniref:helix-turn-helix domain-containing protein n=1 Tax=Streptomyces TaxID=1883 RepID=UPI001FD0D832|nr:helix-turn-helix transcriptional regulator [Streptomyces kasugaensis]